jgi:hypothetical protein
LEESVWSYPCGLINRFHSDRDYTAGANTILHKGTGGPRAFNRLAFKSFDLKKIKNGCLEKRENADVISQRRFCGQYQAYSAQKIPVHVWTSQYFQQS